MVDYAPLGKKFLPSIVILKIKRDANGKPVRFKARLGVLGNLQGLIGDYSELYAPVACIELIRVLLAVAEALGWNVQLVDVKSAFVHATLPASDEIYVQLPHLKCIPSIYGKILGLYKSLYGLRQ